MRRQRASQRDVWVEGEGGFAGLVGWAATVRRLSAGITADGIHFMPSSVTGETLSSAEADTLMVTGDRIPRW